MSEKFIQEILSMLKLIIHTNEEEKKKKILQHMFFLFTFRFFFLTNVLRMRDYCIINVTNPISITKLTRVVNLKKKIKNNFFHNEFLFLIKYFSNCLILKIVLEELL